MHLFIGGKHERILYSGLNMVKDNHFMFSISNTWDSMDIKAI